MANRRFDMHHYRHIISRMRLGESDRSLAKAGLIGRIKARELRSIAEAQGWLCSSLALPEDSDIHALLSLPKPKTPHKPSLLEPFREKVLTWHGQGIQGTTIHAALCRDYGFAGSYWAVRNFLYKNVAHAPNATTVLEFAPGEAGQVDFGKGFNLVDPFSGHITPTWFFVMVLAFSRHQYAEIVTDQKIQTWLGCHKRAFEFFGGVPKKIILDNLKSAITKACYYDPIVQRSYADFADEYGFIISPCPPHDPQKKGRTESGVKYIKRNFMPLRQPKNMSEGNGELRTWILETAGNRIHGTTFQKPLTVFLESEKNFLKPLPSVPFDLAYWAQVKLHTDCHVQFAKCFYSAPFRLIGQVLWLKASETSVRIYIEHELVATHPRLHIPGSRHTLDEHLPPNAVAYKMHDAQWCLKQAEEVGPYCLRIIQTLLNDSVVDYLRAAQGIVGFKNGFGSHRLNLACQRALLFNSHTYKTIKMILQKGLDYQPLPQIEAFETLSETYRGSGKYCRPIQIIH